MAASSRVRFLQYLPYFQAQGVEVTVEPLLSNAYLYALYNGGSRWREVFRGYARRITFLMRAQRFDVVIIEKELFPFTPALAERLLRAIGVPYVVDYDDALFHRYDCHSSAIIRQILGRKIDTVMRHSAAVIAGNKYLAERAQKAGARKIEIVPTVVDADRYQPKLRVTGEVPIVGWIGTPKTSRYLKPLLPVFESIKEKMPVRFVAVGAREGDFANSPVEAWPWSEETEVESIQRFDIGIMPLPDTPFERGKCGYKLIQYMACGLPIVASPVGVNKEIVVPEKNGLLAETVEEWDQALRALLQADFSNHEAMGSAGRACVEKWYSLGAQSPRLLATIFSSIE
ncbi:glycosyltransferase family 4 protein [Chromohalobacter sp. 11-W]|uniref:glycosyltransferase family 4 protein n=1 Tax=Chromohalobacter sp. 11-W TaxID=2994061 RepID=UPI002469AD2E|nr:glycosyltransferase family 4 protein [Chromohalobacter sp. 11-W]